MQCFDPVTEEVDQLGGSVIRIAVTKMGMVHSGSAFDESLFLSLLSQISLRTFVHIYKIPATFSRQQNNIPAVIRVPRSSSALHGFTAL